MKRSEVANMIANRFYESNVEPEKAEEIANEVLKELEDFGMLPPPIIKPVDEYKIKVSEETKSLTYFKTGQTFATVNEWEPE